MTESEGLPDFRVAIVGLGLMGGSLAAALSTRGVCREVVGVARREESLVEALGRGWIDVGTCQLADGLQGADLVILAMPPRVILHQLPLIGTMLKPGCILIDLASTKADVVSQMEQLPAGVHPIGGHPMCGKERPGLAGAEPDLFVDRPFVLTPTKRTPAPVISLASDLATALGARPVLLDATAHDRIMARISHLPHLTALALVRTALAGAGSDPELWQLASSGFRDSTRLAASDRTMMLDIFLTNRVHLLATAQELIASLDEFCELLITNDEAGLERFLDAAIQQRRELEL